MALRRLRIVTHRHDQRYPGVMFRGVYYTAPELDGLIGALVSCTPKTAPDTGWRLCVISSLRPSGAPLAVAIEAGFEQHLDALHRLARPEPGGTRFLRPVPAPRATR